MAYNSPLFYNEGEEIGRISKQLYLSFPSSVVIFYTDKPPTVGLSIFQSIEDAQELNFEELNELIKENPDLKTHLSQLPVFEMDPLQTSDANKILGFSENIFTEMDKGAEENYMVTYKINLLKSQLNDLFEYLLNFFFEYELTGSHEILMGNPDEDQEANELLESTQEKKIEFFSTHLKSLYENGKTKDALKNLALKILYFAHNMTREFFLNNERIILTEILDKFEAGGDLKQKARDLLVDSDAIDLNDSIYESFSVLPVLDNTSNFPNETKYQEKRRARLQNALKDFYDSISETIKEFVLDIPGKNENVPAINFNDLDNQRIYTNLLDFFFKLARREILKTYSDKYISALKNNQMLQNIGIDDFDSVSQEQLNLLKKYLVETGQTFMRVTDDYYELSMIDSDLFVFEDDEILLI